MASYSAFISYSYKDKTVAKWLITSLEAYRFPKNIAKQNSSTRDGGRRLKPLFRDRDELRASADLAQSLRDALDASENLIVLCSPNSANSPRVAYEIRYFQSTRRSARIFCLIIAGQTPEDFFSQQLIASGQAEPLAADLRRGGDGRVNAKLKLIAAISGIEYDELRRRDAVRRSQQMTTIAAASVVGMTLTVGLALYANYQRLDANRQRDEAVRQTQIAVRQEIIATSTTNFLVDTFESTNPSSDNPNNVSALSILKKGERDISRKFHDNPEVKARIVDAISRSLHHLGLNADAESIIEANLSAIDSSRTSGAMALLTLAHLYRYDGRFDDALKLVILAENKIDLRDPNSQEVMAYAQETRGVIQYDLGNYEKALAFYRASIKEYQKMKRNNRASIARVLSNIGIADQDAGKFPESEMALKEADALFSQEYGENDFFVGQNLLSLASVQVERAELEEAEKSSSKAIFIISKTVDHNSLLYANALVIRASALQLEDKFAESESLLTEAIPILNKGYKGRYNPLIGQAETLLAIAVGMTGSVHEAENIFGRINREYKKIYTGTNSNQGDLLVAQGKMHGRLGYLTKAKRECAEGLSILKGIYGVDSALFKEDLQDCKSVGVNLTVHGD